MTLDELVCKELTVMGVAVPRQVLRDVVDKAANLPAKFRSLDFRRLYPDLSLTVGGYAYWQEELANRLLQRWRKLGIVEFTPGGYWVITSGGWNDLQKGWSWRP